MVKNACKDCEHSMYIISAKVCAKFPHSVDFNQVLYYRCEVKNRDGNCLDFKEKTNANIKTESQIEPGKTLESPKKKTTETQEKTWRNGWFVLHK